MKPHKRGSNRTFGQARVDSSRFADSVLALLSLEVKIGQLTMSPSQGLETGPHVPQGSEEQLRRGLLGSVIGVTGSVARPVKQLVRFHRARLRAGESETVSFALGPVDLACYDLRMRLVIEPGSFTLFAGTSSANTAERHFRVTGDTMVISAPPPRMQQGHAPRSTRGVRAFQCASSPKENE